MSKINNIDTRSSQMQAVLGYIPKWIVRFGISLVLLILALLLILAAFIAYPERITAPVTIYRGAKPFQAAFTKTGVLVYPAELSARQVKKGEVVAVLASGLDYAILTEIKTVLQSDTGNSAITYQKYLSVNLAEMQNPFKNFLLSRNEYLNFLNDPTNQAQIVLSQKELESQERIFLKQKTALQFTREQLIMQKKGYAQDSVLYTKQLLSRENLENRKNTLLNLERSLISEENSLSTQQISTLTQEQNYQQTLQKWTVEKNSQKEAFLLAKADFLASATLWENNYCLTAPFSGKFIPSANYKSGQNIAANENIGIIAESKQSAYLAEITVSAADKGKIAVGQKVIIRLYDFPEKDFCTLSGIVAVIPAVVSGETVKIEAILPNQLLTGSNKQLPDSPQLNGTADIVCKKYSVLARILEPLRKMLE